MSRELAEKFYLNSTLNFGFLMYDRGKDPFCWTLFFIMLNLENFVDYVSLKN